MNYKNWSNEKLVPSLKDFVKSEKAMTLQILHLLNEVEKRKLQLSSGHPSLYKFCIQELGYSEAEALVRIRAMRLLRSLPELETKIESGEISLSNAAELQNQIRREDDRRKCISVPPLASTLKRDLLVKLVNSSNRECQRTLAVAFPEIQPVAQERTKVLKDERTLIQFSANPKLMAKLDTLKGLLAHKNYSGSYEALFEELADLALKKLDPLRRNFESLDNSSDHSENKSAKVAPAANSADESIKNTTGDSVEKSVNKTAEGKETPFVEPLVKAVVNASLPLAPQVNSSQSSRYISISIRRQIWTKAKGRCEYQNPKTGQRCNSTHALEIDHIRPFANGGSNSESNLRLYCDSHNRWRIKSG